MKFPNTVSVNTLKAYVNLANCQENDNINLNSIDFDWDINRCPESLRVQCINVIGANWQQYPIFWELSNVEDRNYLLDIIDVNLSVKEMVKHIQEDVLWKRCFQNRWQDYYPIMQSSTTNASANHDNARHQQKWVTIFMEKYLSKTLENMRPYDYEIESIQHLLAICAPYVNTLEINQLQPSLVDDKNCHIPFDVILKSLTGLHKINLTYDIKSVSTQFYLGCSNITEYDIKYLSIGLQYSQELKEFRLHSNRLEPYMLKMLSQSMEQSCFNLQVLEFPHCQCGDIGLKTFLSFLNYESFPKLKCLNLANNNITHEGAVEIANAIKTRNIEILDLRLNPIKTDGASILLAILHLIPIKELNLCGCSMDNTLENVFLKVLKENKTLRKLNVSVNSLGKNIGEKIVNILQNNCKQLQEFDIRNTGIQWKEKSFIDAIILLNRDKLK